MKRRTEITIEASRLTLISRSGGATSVWCSLCDAQVEMVSPDQAAILSLLSTRIIHRMVDEGTLHFIETPAGSVLICLNSLCARGSEETSK